MAEAPSCARRSRLLLGIISVQLVLTAGTPAIGSPAQLRAWVVVCLLTLGFGMPVMFSTMIDFIPVRDRVYVSAAVAGLAFSVAALYPLGWRIEEFSRVLAIGMVPAVVVLAVLSVKRFTFIDRPARRHEGFGIGRFCTRGGQVRAPGRTFWVLVMLMFGVFFIDSLDFLRIIESPVLVASPWQSPDLAIRWFIAVMHVVGAFAAGVFYPNFGRRWLFLWVLGLFAFTHLQYTFFLRGGADSPPPLVLPMFYVLAVSFYTTLNFALRPDHGTSETIGVRTGTGVGIAGWLASFLSTSLALYSQEAGVSRRPPELRQCTGAAGPVLLPVALYTATPPADP